LGSIRLCHNIRALHLVQLQNHKIFWSNMTTHGSCAMVLIIDNQTFSTLGIILIYHFLLHTMAQNSFHSLKANIHNIIKV
jgi:hypothetical protein